MENEYFEPPSQSPVALIINPQIGSFLTETIKWGKFLAILGFVFTGLMVLLGIFIMVAPSSGTSYLLTQRFQLIVGPVYVLMSLLYFFPSRFLYRFCQNIKTALLTSDQQALNFGFENLKSNFKFWGITCLIMIVFYVILAVGAFIVQFLFRS